MSKVAIVIDSTAYMPSDLFEGYPIHIVPLQLIWGEETYMDGVDIQPTEFYKRLPDSDIIPTTSQPSPAAFEEIYKKLLDDGFDILSIHISSGLSGTVDSANQAKAMFKGANIEIVDSMTTSLPLGFSILKAIQIAKDGASLDECRAIAEKAKNHSNIYFVVKNLEYLRRGGRIGGGAAFVGNALNLKPILTIKDGKVEAAERVRTMKKAISRMLEIVEADIGGRKPLHLGVIHVNAHQAGQELLDESCKYFKPDPGSNVFCADVSPVIGTHVGPGTVGLAYLAGI